MRKNFNHKRRIALFLSATVAATTILSVSFSGGRCGEQKAVASEKTYHAMVGFQTDKYDSRVGYETMEVDAKYNAWLTGKGKKAPDYGDSNIYLNGYVPSLYRKDLPKKGWVKGELDLDSAARAQLADGAVVTDATLGGDGEYTVSIEKLNLKNENEQNFKMLYVATDIVKNGENQDITVKATSVKVGGQEIARNAVLPVEGDVTDGDYYKFMIANAYAASDNTDSTLLYPTVQNEMTSTTALKVPNDAFDIEITFTIEGLDEKPVVETPMNTATPPLYSPDGETTASPIPTSTSAHFVSPPPRTTSSALPTTTSSQAPSSTATANTTASPIPTSTSVHFVSLPPRTTSSALPTTAASHTPVSTVTPSPTATASVPAASKPYGDKLKLNNEIKLNATKSYVKKGYTKMRCLFPKKKTVKVKYSISCKRKSEGNNYKVTYKVNYKYLNDPKISGKKQTSIEWGWMWYIPGATYTVFDYQTGKCIEKKNNLGVKVKGGKWKYSYYPKQRFQFTDECIKREKIKSKGKPWLRNTKTISYQFTVTYPKDCKDVVVGIGFYPSVGTQPQEKDYWNGKSVYGKTWYYRQGRKTMSYMRLDS